MVRGNRTATVAGTRGGEFAYHHDGSTESMFFTLKRAPVQREKHARSKVLDSVHVSVKHERALSLHAISTRKTGKTVGSCGKC